jgi:4-amino-4-deoxy-L-arabinose transferase-like glycosyltransferase
MRIDLAPLLRRPLGQAVLVIVLTALCVMPGISTLPTIDRDEARFVQATRQMLDAPDWHGYVVPRFGDQLRLQKPPAIYWFQSASVAALGGVDDGTAALWMHRLPGAIAAIVTALVTWRLGRIMFGPMTGTLAGILIGICPLVAFDAHQARADQVMVATTTLMMLLLWRMWSTRTGPTPWLTLTAMYALCALGVLLKGPITPFVLGSTALCMAAATRSWRWIIRLQPWTGAVIVLAFVVPWVVLAAREIGGDTIAGAIRREVFERAGSGMEGHWAPPGYHLVLLPVLFFPGSLLTGLAIQWAWARARRSRTTGSFVQRFWSQVVAPGGRHPELFLLCWLLPTWIAFELVATKLPHYVLPCYPAIALLSARVVVGGMSSVPRALEPVNRFGYGVWAVIGCGIAWAPAGLLAACHHAGLLEDASLGWRVAIESPLTFMVLLLGGYGTLMMWRARQDALRGDFAAATRRGIVITVMSLAWTMGVLLPRLPAPWITRRALAHAWQAAASRSLDDLPPIAAVGYVEDSLLFESGRRAERIGPDELADWIAAHPDGLVLSTVELMAPGGAAEANLPALRPVEPARVRGFNYSKGRIVEVQLYEVVTGD